MKKIYFQTLNIIFAILSILIFELGYCNHTFLENLIKNGEITKFYISPFRIIVYIIIFTITLIFNKKYNFEETKEKIKSRKKYLIIFIIISILIFGMIPFIKETIYMIEISLMLNLLLSIFISIIYFSEDYTKNIILVGIIASIFTISIDTYHELDEKKYFMQSFNMAYFNIDYSNPIVDKIFMYDVGARDKLSEYYKIKYEFQEETLDELSKEKINDSTPANYNDVFFIASAFGIFIARILNGSVADIFVMGRLCNLIIYILLIRYAIKIIPFKKNILFIISSMPMLLALSASYSIDALGYAIAMVFIANILKIYNENKIKLDNKTILITFISFVILLCYKYMAYAFIGLIIFILPLKEIIKENKKQLIKMFLIALGILIVLYSIQLLKGTISISDPRGGETNALSQINFMVENPIRFAKIMVNTLSTHYLNYNWWADLHMNIFFGEKSNNIFFIILLFYFYVALSDTSKNFNIKEKIIFISIFILTMIFITIIMYITFNPIALEIVLGVQARYMYIVLPLLMFAISSDKLTRRTESNNSNIIMIQIMIIFLSVIQTIL